MTIHEADTTAVGSAVTELERIIVEDAQPGDSLPSEADLAHSLGMSRLTIREAMRVVAGRGLLHVTRGRRARVRATDSSVLSDYFGIALRRDPRGLLELNDVRASLETLSVEGATRGASAAGLDAIHAALVRMESAAASAEDDLLGYHDADLEFHGAIALASGNRMLALILESLSECLRQSFIASARGHLERGGTVLDDLAAHRNLSQAIHAGDAARASQVMKKILALSARDLRAIVRSSAR